MPKSGASISREISGADVFSASFLHVILNLVSSINVWQSPLCTEKCSCACKAAPCTCTSWVPRLMGHAPHSHPTASGGGGVGRARLNALTDVSSCWCSRRGGICCSCPKQRTGEGGSASRRLCGQQGDGGCSAPLLVATAPVSSLRLGLVFTVSNNTKEKFDSDGFSW